MATTKKTAAISKHKTTTARKPKAASPQAMDIIPKSRVRPSTTSRPVITATTPAVADSTLKAPSSAPTLQVKRRTITIKPTLESDLDKEDVLPNIAISTPSVPSAASADKPVVTTNGKEGVSVTELLAKRAEKTIPVPVNVTESPAETTVPPEAVTTEEQTPVAANAEPAIAQPAELQPTLQPEVPAAASPDDHAAAEAARLLSDEPDEPAVEVPIPQNDPPEPVNQQSDAAPEPTANEPANQPQAQAVEAKPAQSAATTSQPVADTGSVAADAARDTADTAQNQDETIPETSADIAAEAEQKHQPVDEPKHELYDGKPVIIVHKDHGSMSALAWVLWFIICVGLALLIVNFLLDAGIIETTYRIPHTDIL